MGSSTSLSDLGFTDDSAPAAKGSDLSDLGFSSDSDTPAEPDYAHPAGISEPAPALPAHPAADMQPRTLSSAISGVQIPQGAQQQVEKALSSSYESNPGPTVSAAKTAVGAGKDLVSGTEDIFGAAKQDFQNSGGNPFVKLPDDVAKQNRDKALGGAAKLITGGGTVAMAVEAPAVLEVAAKAIGGDLAAKVAIAKIAASIGLGAGASATGGAVADKYNVSPGAKNLIQAVSFFVPSLMGIAAGVKTDLNPDVQGRPAASVSAFGGRVRAGVVADPEAFAVGGKVGDIKAGVKIPRGQPAPPDPAAVLNAEQADAGTNAIVRAATKAQQAAQVVAGGPPPPPPGPPMPEGMANGVISQQIVHDITAAINIAPPEEHPKLIMEAHGKLTEYIQKQGRIIGPDGKLSLAETPQQAAKLAQNIINDEVDRQHQAKEDAAKAQADAVEQQKKGATKPAEDGGLSPADKQWQRAKTIIESTTLQPKQTMESVLRRNLGVGPQTANEMVQRYAMEAKDAATPTVGSKKEPVVEESRATVDAQLEALKRGDTKVVMLPEGSKYRPATPEGMKLMAVRGDVPGAGFYIYDPKQIHAATIKEAAKAGTHGDLMGHIQTKEELAASPEKPTVVVQAQDKDGTPIQDSQVHPERVEQQIEAMQERHPDAKVVVKQPDEVIDDRLAEQEPEGLTNLGFEDEPAEVAPKEEKEKGEPSEKNPEQSAGEVSGATEPTPAPKEHKYDFGNIQHNIDESSPAAKALDSARAKVKDSDLAGDGRDIGENHVTVRYGLRATPSDKLKAFIRSQAPFEAKLGKVTAFPPHADAKEAAAAPLIASVEAPELHRINGEIDKHDDFEPSSFPEYKPHATIAYVKPGAVSKYVGDKSTEGETFMVRSISVGDRDGNSEDIKLEGEPEVSKPAAKPIARGDTVDFKDLKGTERTGVVAHAGDRITRIKSEGKEYTVPVKKVTKATKDVVNQETPASNTRTYQAEVSKFAGDPKARMESIEAENRRDAEAKLRRKFPKEIIASAERVEDAAVRIGGVDGKETSVLTPNGKHPGRYRLVESDDLMPSHHPLTYAKNPNYPEGVQERDYEKQKDAQMRVQTQAQNLDPAYLLNTNPDAVNGPPVITPDGVVLGGNSRAMSTMKAKVDHPEKYAAYRDALKEQASEFGLSAEQVRLMKSPMLVREVEKPTSTKAMHDLGRDLNKSMTGGLSVAEKAVSSGKSITAETMDEVSRLIDATGADASVRDMLREHGDQVLELFEKNNVITRQEASGFRDGGEISEEGKTFIERSLLGSIVDDPQLYDATPKSILNKLDGSLAAVTNLAAEPDEFNIIPAIRDALEQHAEIAERKTNIDAFQRQNGLLDVREANPLIDTVARKLAEKPTAVRKALREFAADAKDARLGQGSLLGESKSAFELFNDSFGSTLTEEEYRHGLARGVSEEEPRAAASRAAAGDHGVSEESSEQPETEGAREVDRADGGRPSEFVAAPDGSLDFGEIPAEVSEAIGGPQGPIRLRQGTDKYGLKHIEARHGEGIRKRGYPSVEAFVEHIAKNFDAIYSRPRGSLDMVLSEGDYGRMIVHLEPSAAGDFYDVKTATPSRDNQYKNKDPLWERTGTSTTLSEESPLHPRGQSGDDSVAQPDEKDEGIKYLHGGLGIPMGALKPLAQIKPVADVIAFLGDEAERVAVSRDLHNRLYDMASQDNAAVLRTVQMLKGMPGTAKDQQAIYHHLEDPKSVTLTPEQETILDDYLTPLIYQAEHDFQVVTEGGVPLENYVHRQVRDRGGIIDRIMEKVKDKTPSNGIGGGRLTKTAPGQKHRTMMAIEDAKTGKRQVVSIKGGRVTLMKQGQEPQDIGGLRNGLTTVGAEVDERMAPFVKRVTELRDEIAGAKDADRDEQLADVQGRIAELRKQMDTLLGVKTRTGQSKPDMFDKGGKLQYSRETTFNQRAEITKKLDPLLKREELLKNGTAPMLAKNASKLLRAKAELKGAEAFRDAALNELPPETFADKAWKDRNGTLYKITQATTKEIEANTNVRYYQNAAASVAVNYLAMDKARRAYEFLEEFKKSPEFAAASHSINSPGAIPKGWKATQLPQFRGYFFEPHIAEVLDAYAARAAHDPSVLEKVGNFMRASIFFNPLIHIPNLLNHWVVEKGVSGFANPMNYPTITRAGIKAINAVIHQNRDFLEALDHGAPLQSQQFETKQFADLFFRKMQDELGDPESSKAKELATAIGMSPVRLVKAIYDFSGKATWYTNDIAFLQSAYEKQERGMSLKDALTETAKHIPDYRLMTRIFDNPRLAKLMSNPNITMFGAYHYGALKSYGQMAKSLTGFNWTDAGTKNEQGEPTNAAGRTEGEEKLHGLDTLAMLALVTFVVYPLIDKLLREFTSNSKAQMRRAGASTLVYNLAMLAKGEKTPTEVAESVATPAVQTQALAEMVLNRDLRTGQRLYDPHASGKKLASQVGRQVVRSVAPVSQGMDIAEGRTDVKRLMYSMVGVSFPLHGAEKIAAMITAERLSSLPPREEDEIAHAIQRSRALHDAWAGDRSKLIALLQGKDFTPKEKAKIRRDVLLPPIVYAVRGMTYDDAVKVYHAADSQQRHQLHPLMSKKLARLLKEGKKPEDILGKDDDN